MPAPSSAATRTSSGSPTAITWGLGHYVPDPVAVCGRIVEWQGEFVIKDNTLVLNPPFVGEDGSIAPILSPISDPTNFKVGAVWQRLPGFFVHGGLNYSFGTGDRAGRLATTSTTTRGASMSASAGIPE